MAVTLVPEVADVNRVAPMWLAAPRRRMQDVDDVGQIEAFTAPARLRRLPVDRQSPSDVGLRESADWIRRHRRSCRHVRKRPAARPPEAQSAVGLSLYVIPLFV